MRRYTLIPLILAVVLTMNGCASEVNSVEGKDKPTESFSNGLNIRDPSYKAEEHDDYPYVHGEEGYFNLGEQLPGFVKKQQDGGTCWIFAGAASMQT